MATSIRQFNIALYEEHLEEAAFLYEQRLVYLHDLELLWPELEEIEERFEAHIDALIVGEDLALEVCKRRCWEGDIGELHAAVRVFCRLCRSDLTYAVLQNADVEHGEVAHAVINALKAECPDEWHDDLTSLLLGTRTQLIGPVAAALGYRRAPVEETLCRVVGNADAAALPYLLKALGRVGGETSRSAISPYLRSENEAVAEAASRALVRLGDYHAVRHGLLVAQAKPWPILSLGIGGDQAAVNVLTEIVRSDKVSNDALVALGMLGDLSSVNHIYNCLQNPEVAMAAAVALQTITGAALYEEIFVPEEIDPDELFEDERQEYEATGAVPVRPDGQPFGESMDQISINPDMWRRWLEEHRHAFDVKHRFRHGRPISPAASYLALESRHTPNRVRDLIVDEFHVRYGGNFSLEIDLPVRQQLKELGRIREWVKENQSKFAAGHWYFAGKPMQSAH